MRKNTPGPWITEGDAVISPSIPWVIAWISDHEDEGPQEAERKANARLIAAAPDMLEMLRRLSWFFDGMNGPYCDARRDILELIAKVDGKES